MLKIGFGAFGRGGELHSETQKYLLFFFFLKMTKMNEGIHFHCLDLHGIWLETFSVASLN